MKIAEIRLISAYPCTLAMPEVEALRLALGNIAVQKGVPGSHLCSFNVAVHIVTAEIHMENYRSQCHPTSINFAAYFLEHHSTKRPQSCGKKGKTCEGFDAFQLDTSIPWPHDDLRHPLALRMLQHTKVTVVASNHLYEDVGRDPFWQGFNKTTNR